MIDGRLNFDTKIDTKGFSKGVSSLGSQLNGLKSMLAKVGAALGLIFSGKEAIEAAANINAANSQLQQTFGSLQSAAESAMKKVADTSQIVQSRLQSVGTSIYAFAKTAGMESAEALKMMEEALQVTADSAAYYDRSLEDTAESLKSFLKGNFENDAALGLSCTETTRNAAANKLYGKSFTELSEAQKQLTLLQMVKDANALSGAEGQAAREADGWENVMGNLKETWKQFLGVIGQPILSVAVTVVKNMTSALQELTKTASAAVNALSEVFGIQLMNESSADDIADSTSAAADNYSDMANSAEATQEANENSLASFDKINKLDDTDSSSSSSAGSSAITAGQGSISINAEVDTSEAESSLSEFFSNLKNYFNTNFKDVFNGLKSEFSELGEIFSDIFSDIKSLSKPLKKYLLGDFTTYLKKVFTVSVTILTGLLDTFNMVFSDIWNFAVFPMLKNFLSVGLPILTQFQTQVWGTLGVLFTSVKSIFDRLWQDAVSPILSFISQLWCDTWQTISDFWSKWGQPIFDGINTAITTTKDLFLNIWESVLQPIFEKSMETLDKIWTEHLQPLIAEFLDFVGELITGATDIYNQFIAPIVNWLVSTLGPIVAKVFNEIQTTIGAVAGNTLEVIRGLYKSVIQFISGIFTGNWKKAWEGIKNIFKGIWNSFASIVSIPINLIIGMINRMTSGIESAINWIVDGINSISIDVPDALSSIVGFDTLGFNLNHVNIPQIPMLAKGAVIPPNSEFLAVLGDQKRGTNIEAPLDTIKQAVAEVLAAKGGGGMSGPLTIPIYLNTRRGLRLLSTEIIDDINDIISSTGNVPIDL